ncbi:DUF72 domain-containing protein [Sediminispirochaeta bajacaliforniensis]|uniref:DUF72 domain-containing protein n=1 Tax=Sediminispirochaeta bajacaliforniensis TaxID=148 RepID=UPI000382329D|nr:DUF72 domain-containing protein [Sediminispirochaeta bajacaliforniensis]
MHYIGTSGYSYSDWIGPFYPKGIKSGDFLSWYARFFSFTEINFTYYRMPEENIFASMLASVPKGFLFSVKAHASLTHQRTKEWKDHCKQFQTALAPLVQADALAGVLLQFPFSFHYTPENRIYLDALLGELYTTPCFVEFRNTDWQIERVFEGLKRRNCGLVVTDAPQLRGTPRYCPEITNQDAYFRFHGRNSVTWWTGDNATRYDYRYSEKELFLLAEGVLAAEKKARNVFTAFNNHKDGQAPDNAEKFQEILHGTSQGKKSEPVP